jgi:membrane associated rhomboid family serine protease
VGQGDERAEPPTLQRGPHEPALRAPWPALGLTVLLVGLYVLQRAAGDADVAAARFGFAPAGLGEGRWQGLITALFVHGGWAHVLLNAFGALAFGAPVARLLGRGAVGGMAFLLFFLVCGAVSSLGFAALHPREAVVLVGASGAVSGLMGAASRLIDRRDTLAPFASRTVIGMALSWVVVNVLIGLVGLDAVSGGAPIAWEAHLAGYAVGLLLVGPTVRLLRRPVTQV